MFKKFFLLLILLFFSSRPVLAAGVEYNLPYPGLLPDSPFYLFKMARDNIVERFISDPRQKAFYLLLMSDKRLAAGQALIKKGEVSAGSAAVVKSQEYYTRAVDAAVKIKNLDLTSKLVVAGTKHEEVIGGLTGNENLQKALIANQKDKNRVLELLVQPQK